MKEQVELALTTENSKAVFYLQRHDVEKERRWKFKWRIVFDASYCECNSPSLNDVLGMVLILPPEVLAALLRFRLHLVAVISDIKQAFLQLSQDRRGRDITNFFWYKISKDYNGNRYTTHDVVTYMLTRLPFDLTCSSFLLYATVKELVATCREEYPNASPCLVAIILWTISSPR